MLWSFSLPALLSSSLVGPVTWFCSAMLVNQPHGYTEMGVFNAANQWRATILFVPAAVGAIVLPILSNLQGTNERSRYRKVLWFNILLNGGVALAIALPVSLLSGTIMNLYGAGFKSGSGALVLLSLATVLSVPSSVVGQAIASAGRMRPALALNALWAVVMIGASFWLTPYGARGLALAYAISYLFHLCTVGCYARFVMFEGKG